MKSPIKKRCRNYRGQVEVCCHDVAFRYNIGQRKLTDELKSYLEQEAEERAKSQIIEGYQAGELNCLVHDDVAPGGEEIRGWWNINWD